MKNSNILHSYLLYFIIVLASTIKPVISQDSADLLNEKWLWEDFIENGFLIAPMMKYSQNHSWVQYCNLTKSGQDWTDWKQIFYAKFWQDSFLNCGDSSGSFGITSHFTLVLKNVNLIKKVRYNFLDWIFSWKVDFLVFFTSGII